MFNILFINFSNFSNYCMYLYQYKVFYERNRYNYYLKFIGNCIYYIYLNYIYIKL